MSPKKKSSTDGSDKKKRMMLLEMKHEITEKHEQGVCGVDLARQYEQNTSTIYTILKQNGVTKGHKTNQGHHNHQKMSDLCSRRD